MRGCPGIKQLEGRLAVNEFWLKGVLRPSLDSRQEKTKEVGEDWMEDWPLLAADLQTIEKAGLGL